ncbi:MAG: DUF2071 domain-containing protein [Planctomycetota bacterium]|jgi:uncharacterized protein YqjF (DUF2071 family)
MSVHRGELAVLGALAASEHGLPRAGVERVAADAGIGPDESGAAIDALHARALLRSHGPLLRLTPAGIEELLRIHAALERAVDPSAPSPDHEIAQSVPWLTTVRTCWIDALSFNYAVTADALAPLLPAPLEPEIHKGSGWIQVLVSSLRDLRPRGLPSLFGSNFYQVSYRAAVVYRDAGGAYRRGGYFLRSETNNRVMRAIGNRLAEFKFHDFGAATMSMIRKGDDLIVGVEPEDARPGGGLVAVVPTVPLAGPPGGSAWVSIEDLHEPLVECYDALGVDEKAGSIYILTIDRSPWRPAFVQPAEVYCEYFESGTLAGHARLDSVLHIGDCEYRWRPLRRVPIPRAERNDRG